MKEEKGRKEGRSTIQETSSSMIKKIISTPSKENELSVFFLLAAKFLINLLFVACKVK